MSSQSPSSAIAQDSSENAPLQSLPPIEIDGVDEPVVLNYFETLNQGKFQATSQLFNADGVLCPPFEEDVVGQAAISTYLEKEAKGLILYPQKGSSQVLENGCLEYEIGGKVKTPFFSVNVSWQFILNPWNEILFVKVKLLASLQELFNLREQEM